MEEAIDRKNLIVMKLLHYFITEKNYNPIILQGAEDEIWLENLSEDYKIVRIVSNYLHNDEQLGFDLFKTKKIMQRIKRKTFSFHINTLNIYTDLGDNVHLESQKDIDNIYLFDETDLEKYPFLQNDFPEIENKLKFNEEGLQLFMKITSDINRKNKTDAEKVEEVFKPKQPIVTYILLIINLAMYMVPPFLGALLHQDLDPLLYFSVYGPNIRAGEYYRLITGTFLHANLIHLLVNCYSLYIIGGQIESFMGKTKYLIIYLFSALMGSLLSMAMGNYISVGASGAIFGLMGSLVYFGYHYRVYLGNVMRSQIIPLVLINLLSGFVFANIDNAAHIGGLVGGTLITIALGVKYKSTTFEKVNGWIVTAICFAFFLYMGIFMAS